MAGGAIREWRLVAPARVVMGCVGAAAAPAVVNVGRYLRIGMATTFAVLVFFVQEWLKGYACPVTLGSDAYESHLLNK